MVPMFWFSVAVGMMMVVEMRRRRKRKKDKMPVLLLTDIGRDIDDTLALLTIAGYREEIELVGVVATGGNGANRAILAKSWLHKLKLDKVKVCACLADGKSEIEFPTFLKRILLKSQIDARTLITDLLRKYSHTLRIVAIAPLSPLLPLVREKQTLDLLRQNTHSIWIQGQLIEQGKTILPDVQNAYNLRIDANASRQVFEKLQHDVLFRFLGKHAAYQVSLTPQDFASFDMILPSMSDMAKQFLKPFRNRRPELFRKLHGGDHDDAFDTLDALSHPYDAALIVALVHDHVLRDVQLRHKFIGNTSDTVLSKEHANLVHSELVRTMQLGLAKFIK